MHLFRLIFEKCLFDIPVHCTGSSSHPSCLSWFLSGPHTKSSNVEYDTTPESESKKLTVKIKRFFNMSDYISNTLRHLYLLLERNSVYSL